MELRDLIVTPVVILFVYMGAFIVRPHVTNEVDRKYFFPALTLRIFGALMLGFIYQFYYSGGDTYNYYTFASRIIWETFIEDPVTGLRLIFSDVSKNPDLYEYGSRIIFFRDPNSYFIVRIAAFFDLFTFSTYSATAVLFAAISFAGSWTLFKTFSGRYPDLHWPLAISTFFVPSLFFWGAGILKDTIALAALSFLTAAIDKLFIRRNWNVTSALIMIISIFVIFEIKKFILQAYLPAAFLWVSYQSLQAIRSTVARALVFPLVVMITFSIGLFTVFKVGEGDRRYSVERLAETARITAYDIGFYTGREAGSGYSLGELDGTLGNMLGKAPAAINVALFRPYLWEIRNPLMALSALESFFLLGITLYVVIFRFGRLPLSFKNADVVFLFTFSIVMAFAVGITSYNFGTLSRYRLPLIPFFLITLIITLYTTRYPRVEGNYGNNEASEPA